MLDEDALPSWKSRVDGRRRKAGGEAHARLAGGDAIVVTDWIAPSIMPARLDTSGIVPTSVCREPRCGRGVRRAFSSGDPVLNNSAASVMGFEDVVEIVDQVSRVRSDSRASSMGG